MFHNGQKVRSLAEELAEEGLNPDKVMGEIDRNIRLMEAGPTPVSVSGLPEGDTTPRSLSQVGREMLAEDVVEATPSDLDEIPIEEGRKITKFKTQSKSARKRDRKKKLGGMAGLKRAGRYAKIYYKRHKSKIKRKLKKFMAKVGGSKKLAAMRKKLKGRGRIQVTGLEILSNLAEELEASTAVESDTSFSPFEEAVVSAGWLTHMLGEIFEQLGDERAAEALYRVGDYAANVAEQVETLTEDSDLTEDQEDEVKRVLEATQKAVTAWEALGCPTLDEAVTYAMEEAKGDSTEDPEEEDEDEEEDEEEEDCNDKGGKGGKEG